MSTPRLLRAREPRIPRCSRSSEEADEPKRRLRIGHEPDHRDDRAGRQGLADALASQRRQPPRQRAHEEAVPRRQRGGALGRGRCAPLQLRLLGHVQTVGRARGPSPKGRARKPHRLLERIRRGGRGQGDGQARAQEDPLRPCILRVQRRPGRRLGAAGGAGAEPRPGPRPGGGVHGRNRRRRAPRRRPRILPSLERSRPNAGTRALHRFRDQHSDRSVLRHAPARAHP